jgi:exopolysaccharide biosynthesis polyprenyl glycosylphosphotransferase
VAELAAAGVPVLGTPDEVLGAVAGKRADSVVVAGQGLMSRHGLRRLAWQLQSTDTGLFLASQLSDVAAPRITVRTLSGLPLLQVQAPVFDGGQRRFKSLMDRLLAAALLLAFAPVLVVVAALVGLSSPGGVLYRQERIGLGQRPFRCLKFRTMYSGADSAAADLRSQGDTDGPLFKMRTDPRVTPVGRVLRRFSLDELPQLFNVLGGSMSLVGPRPPLPDEVAEYGHDVRRRLLVKPGMTGLWQVSGRSDLTWAESVRLDLYYVENWSPLLDLQIIARTAIAVAGGRGAY